MVQQVVGKISTRPGSESEMGTVSALNPLRANSIHVSLQFASLSVPTSLMRRIAVDDALQNHGLCSDSIL